jgi:3-hydroxy-3-methylglutaryl CoA synthase
MTNNKQILDELYAYVNSMQNAYVELSKKDKKKSKEVDAILTATTLIKMKIQSLSNDKRNTKNGSGVVG